jgi:hypothetical protein
MKRKIMFGSQLQDASTEEILEFMETGRKLLEKKDLDKTLKGIEMKRNMTGAECAYWLQHATTKEIKGLIEEGRKILDGSTFMIQKSKESTKVEKLELKVSRFFHTSKYAEASRVLAKLIKAVRIEEAEKYNRERN